MDEFAQSRGDDDLFDDEIVPFDAPPSPQKVATQLEQVSLETPPSPIEADTKVPPASVTSTREESFSASRNKSRGRGGNISSRGAPTKKSGLSESKWATKPTTPASPAQIAKEETSSLTPTEAQPTTEEETQPPPLETHEDESTTSQTTPSNNPSGQPSTASRPPAVRGDRTATGGVRKPKLTEEELSAKLAEAMERSQNRAAAHARAQADAASFEERERVAEQKRAKDRVERKVMDNEREKNRQRKMAVMGGREWDAGKNEEDFRKNGTGRGGRRGYQSGSTPQQQFEQEEDDLKMYEWHEDRGRGRGGRGRGGRGGRGRGRGGRGGFDHDNSSSQQQPGWSAEADFPALPGPNAAPKKQPPAETTPKPSPRRWDSGGLPSLGDGGDGGSWAEQVESSEALTAESSSKPKHS